MLDFSNSVFSCGPEIPETAKVVFVSDLFVQDYVGGAELTSEALIESCPVEVFKLHSKDVTLELLRSGADKFWVFGNFANLNPKLIPSITNNVRYTVLEYDYKYCVARSPEKHQHLSNLPCNCASQTNGAMISAFYQGSMGMWWMSEAQKQKYLLAFPSLEACKNTVLSSVFSKQTLGYLKQLREANVNLPRKGWIVLGSDSWVKGASDAEAWCRAHDKSYKIVWNLPYAQLLEKLAKAEGFVYLPKGSDTCPRMVIEAKLLGCELQLNDNVQHRRESWFATDDVESIFSKLSDSTQVFWSGVDQMINYKPTISGYTTTYNAVKQEYPFVDCIKSMLNFCDEVCVVDGGSTDGTWEILLATAAEYVNQDDQGNFITRLKCKQVKRDWSTKRHPVFDGQQKAEARSMCTKEFCWQMDADEIVHPGDIGRIPELCRVIPKEVDVLALPVIEYWGGPEKVRADIQPWKWRLSRNLPHITHGIPGELRRKDSSGELYSAVGSDGCDMIDRNSLERLPFANFYSQETEQVRQAAMSGHQEALKQYEGWFNQVVSGLPSVFHYSWYNLPRKIKLYRDYWQNHWNALWDKDTSDTSENNLMFGVPWSQVTDQMIEDRSMLMKEKLGGWIWHHSWDGITTTPHIKCYRSEPLEALEK